MRSTTAEKTGRCQVCVTVTPRTRQRLKRHQEANGVPIGAFVRLAIDEAFARIDAADAATGTAYNRPTSSN